MFNEYDLNGFEQRLTNIEKRMQKPTFCYFLESKEGNLPKKKQQFDFEFFVEAKTYIKVKCRVVLKQSCLYNLTLLLNQAYVSEWQFNQSESLIEFVLPVNTGLNKASVIFESDIAVEVSECTFETFGNISYKEDDYQLLHLLVYPHQ